MKSYIFILFSSLLNLNLSSQTVYHYKTVLSFGLGKCLGNEMNSELIIDGDESQYTYRSKSLEGGVDYLKKEDSNTFTKTILDSVGAQVYTNTSDSIILSREIIGNKVFLVADQFSPVDWEISKVSKLIGGFRCLQAHGEFRGRHYTAWFTPEIQTSVGPWKLHGLPGLIIEASDMTKDVCFYLTQINSNHITNIENVDRGNRMSFAEYQLEYIKFKKREEENGRLMAEQLGIENYQPIDFDTIIEIPEEER